MFAKLPVSEPNHPIPIFFKGRSVNEHWSAIGELHVEGRRIFKRHTFRQGKILQIENQQSSCLQLRKAPLVGVRDRRNLTWEQHDTVATLCARVVYFLVIDKKARLRSLCIKSGTY